jgi:hypothetical protein
LGTSDLEGRVTVGNSYGLPTADGTAGQVMTTDGNGNVSFTTNSGKTYDISASSTTGGADFNLNSDVPTTDTIKFAEGSGISVVATDANTITIASTSPGTTYDFNASSSTGGANFNLVGSDSTTDTVKLTDGGHITATYTSATVVTLGSDATDANTASAIIARDASGDFSAGQGTFDSGITINGSTSGSSTFTAPATGSTLSYVLPGTAGAASSLLTNDGSGNLSWAPGGGSGIFGNLSIGVAPDLNTIKSTDTNGNIELDPNGSGDVLLTAYIVRVGNSNNDAYITTNGTGDLYLNTNSGTNSGYIQIADGVNQNISIVPNGTGDVYLTADTTVVGDSNADAYITTNGTGDLYLNTNNGTNSGYIRIFDGANQPIDISPNGVGDVRLLADTVYVGDANATATITTLGTGSLVLNTNSGIAGTGDITINQGANANIEINPNGTGDVQLNADTVRVGDSGATATITSNGAGDLVLNTNSGTNSGNITISQGASANISITPNANGDVQLNADTVRIGDTNAAATLISNGNGALTVTTGGSVGNLTLNTNNGSTSGSIVMVPGSNGSISITPHSSTPGTTGNINLTSAKVVVGDGAISGKITAPASTGLEIYGDNLSGGQLLLNNFGTGGSCSLKTSSTSAYILLQSNVTMLGRFETAGNPAYIGTTTGTSSTVTNDLIIQTGDPYFPLVYPTGRITITANANGNISLVPHGTGRTSITNGTIANNLQFNGSTSGTVQFAAPAVAGTQAYTLPTAVPGVSGYVLASDTSGVLSWVNNTATSTFGNVTIGVDSAQTISTTSGSLILQTAGGVNSGTITINAGAGQDMVLSPNPLGEVYLDADVYVGRANTNVQISSNGNADLYLVTGNIAGGGQVRISNGANADVEILPSGTGNVLLTADTVVVGDPAAAATITTNGAGNLTLSTNNGTNSGTIDIAQGVDGNISITPNGTGNVLLTADTVVVGDAAAAATITSNGAGNLTLSTNNGTNSGTILINQGIDGNIAIDPSGSGLVQLNGDVQLLTGYIKNKPLGADINIEFNGGFSNSSITLNTDITLAPDGLNGNVIIDGAEWPQTSTGVTVNSVLTNDGSGNLSWALPGGGGSTFGNVSIGVDTDQTISTSSGNLVLQTAAGVNAGTITLASGTNGNITIEPNGTGDVFLNTDIVRVGDSNVNATVTTNGTGDLILNTNNGTNSGSITIEDGVNGNIIFEPNGTGDVFLKADNTIVGDPNAAATLTTNGTGDLTINTNFGTNAGSIVLANGANGNITIEPNGTGDVFLNTDIVRIGDANTAATLTTNGTGNLTLSTNTGTNSGTILINQGANSNIEITPDGTGDVLLKADTIQIGDSGAAATITTIGAGNLTLSTNNGTNAGTLVFSQGANGNITATPNGTGVFLVSGNPAIAARTNSVGGSIIGRANTTTTGTYLYPSTVAQKVRTDILTAAMTNEPAVFGFSVRDSALVTTNFGRLACTYQGTGSNPFFRFSVSPDGFTTEVVSAVFGGGVALWGSAGTYTHTTSGTTDLILSTNNGTNSGTITINDGANNNIALAPNGTGRVAITNPLRLASYTAAALTALTGAVGDIAAVTDSAGGGNPNGMLAFWDTTNARWSYVHDNSAV